MIIITKYRTELLYIILNYIRQHIFTSCNAPCWKEESQHKVNRVKFYDYRH